LTALHRRCRRAAGANNGTREVKMPRAKRQTVSRKATRQPLTVRDHTTIVKAAIANAENLRKLLPATRKPSGPIVLRTLLKVDAVSAPTKDRIQTVLSVLEALERQQVRLPAKATKAVREVSDQLSAAKSVPEMIRGLKRAIAEKRYADVEGMEQALSLAVGILEDGSSSIYSPDYYLKAFGRKGAEDRGQVTVVAFSVAKEDVKGAVSGAVVGCAAGASGGTIALPLGGTAVGCAGVGAVGGLGGAVAGSVGEVVGGIWDWLF
jgi:hypothetical protein